MFLSFTQFCSSNAPIFFRMIKGWQLSRLMTQPLTLIPLQQAGQQSIPKICHSDLGVQSFSNDYISTLTDYGIEISLTHRGCPWDKGYAERLIRTLMEEVVHINDYDDNADAKMLNGCVKFLHRSTIFYPL